MMATLPEPNAVSLSGTSLPSTSSRKSVTCTPALLKTTDAPTLITGPAGVG